MALGDDVRWGVKLGLVMGGMYTLLALLLFALGGPDRFARNQISLATLVTVYMLGGLAAGLVLGVFRPALRERHTAFVVAFLAAIPVSFGMTVLVVGRIDGWTAGEWSETAVLSLLLAVMGIAVLWKDPDAGSAE
jgi:predicted membrane protein